MLGMQSFFEHLLFETLNISSAAMDFPMHYPNVGWKDFVGVGLIMGSLKVAFMRAFGHGESDLTWFQSYGIWTILSLLTIGLHAAVRRAINEQSRSDNVISSSGIRSEGADYGGKV
jgi:hypothetical protein